MEEAANTLSKYADMAAKYDGKLGKDFLLKEQEEKDKARKNYLKLSEALPIFQKYSETLKEASPSFEELKTEAVRKLLIDKTFDQSSVEEQKDILTFIKTNKELLKHTIQYLKDLNDTLQNSNTGFVENYNSLFVKQLNDLIVSGKITEDDFDGLIISGFPEYTIKLWKDLYGKRNERRKEYIKLHGDCYGSFRRVEQEPQPELEVKEELKVKSSSCGCPENSECSECCVEKQLKDKVDPKAVDLLNVTKSKDQNQNEFSKKLYSSPQEELNSLCKDIDDLEKDNVPDVQIFLEHYWLQLKLMHQLFSNNKGLLKMIFMRKYKDYLVELWSKIPQSSQHSVFEGFPDDVLKSLCQIYSSNGFIVENFRDKFLEQKWINITQDILNDLERKIFKTKEQGNFKDVEKPLIEVLSKDEAKQYTKESFDLYPLGRSPSDILRNKLDKCLDSLKSKEIIDNQYLFNTIYKDFLILFDESVKINDACTFTIEKFLSVMKEMENCLAKYKIAEPLDYYTKITKILDYLLNKHEDNKKDLLSLTDKNQKLIDDLDQSFYGKIEEDEFIENYLKPVEKEIKCQMTSETTANTLKEATDTLKEATDTLKEATEKLKTYADSLSDSSKQYKEEIIEDNEMNKENFIESSVKEVKDNQAVKSKSSCKFESRQDECYSNKPIFNLTTWQKVKYYLLDVKSKAKLLFSNPDLTEKSVRDSIEKMERQIDEVKKSIAVDYSHLLDHLLPPEPKPFSKLSAENKSSGPILVLDYDARKILDSLQKKSK